MAHDGQASTAAAGPPAGTTPEASALLATLASGRCAGVPSPPAQAPAPDIDWSRVVAGARRHRVSLLLDPRAVAALPETARGAWAAARGDALLAIALADETARLARAFDRAALPALFLKGAALSRQLYGDPCARTPRDIDLLVRPESFHAALDVLAGCDYALLPGELDGEGKFTFYHVSLRHAAYGFVVELHIRLAKDERVLPLAILRPFDNAVTLRFPGADVPTLRAEAAVVYAAYHGTRHLWRRLVWIADLAAAARSEAIDWDDVLERIRACGLEQGLATGLALARSLLGAPLPPGVAEDSGMMRAGERLAAVLAPMIATTEPLADEDQVMRRIGRLPYLRLELALHRRMAARWAILADHLRPSPTDQALLPLPGRWAALHYPFRVARVLGAMWSERRRGIR